MKSVQLFLSPIHFLIGTCMMQCLMICIHWLVFLTALPCSKAQDQDVHIIYS